MIKIRAIVLVYYKFNTNRVNKKLIVILLSNNNFLYKDYRLVNPIFLSKLVIIIFNKSFGIFYYSNNIENNEFVILKY